MGKKEKGKDYGNPNFGQKFTMEKGKGIFWGDFRKRKKERKFFLLFSEKEKGKGLKPLNFCYGKRIL